MNTRYTILSILALALALSACVSEERTPLTIGDEQAEVQVSTSRLPWAREEAIHRALLAEENEHLVLDEVYTPGEATFTWLMPVDTGSLLVYVWRDWQPEYGAWQPDLKIWPVSSTPSTVDEAGEEASEPWLEGEQYEAALAELERHFGLPVGGPP